MAGSLTRVIHSVADELKNKRAQSTSALPGLNSMLVPPNSPPRRGTRLSGDAPQHVSWSHMESTGYTPKRGRASNERHELREKACDGRVLICVVSDPSNPKADARSACRVCGAKTAFYCTGCKNFLCHGSQGLTASRIEKIESNDQLASGDTKPTLRMQVFEPKKDMWMSTFAKNCCYLVSHKHAFDTVWQTKHSTIKGVDDEC